jgi:DnaJ-class molecular chaperone
MTMMITCVTCEGSGTTTGGACIICGGMGRVAQRQKRVLDSPSRQVFYRGALINSKSKGSKR